MNRLALATASLLGLAAFPALARADDAPIDFGTPARDGGGTPVRLTPRPRVHVDPAPVHPARGLDRPFGGDPAPFLPAVEHRRTSYEPRQQYIPGHIEVREETVCEPAVYEDRRVPVYVERCTPIFDDVRVPIYEDRRVPRVEWVNDPRTSQLRQVVVGMKTVREKVGERVERRQVGERRDQVRVGTRIERVLVRAEICRVVKHEEWVPGRYVVVGPEARDRHERATPVTHR